MGPKCSPVISIFVYTLVYGLHPLDWVSLQITPDFGSVSMFSKDYTNQLCKKKKHVLVEKRIV